MAEQQNLQSGAITGINVTPLVDIILVLLIIFMVTAKLIHNQRAMALDLPHAVTGTEARPMFRIVMTRAGRVEVNGHAIASDDELLSKARSARIQGADMRATIEADSGIIHGRVMEVLDLLRRAGLSKVAFAVAPRAMAGASQDPPANPGAPR